MFTGIVAGVGRLARREQRAADQRLTIDVGDALAKAALADGASVAVNGVCLTVAARREHGFVADASSETLDRTTLGTLAEGSAVNLEPALALGDALGGHLMSGHVDGVGELVAREPDGRAWRLRLRAPPALARLIAAKGSIAVDGVSLTVNAIDGVLFDVAIIPATLERTIIGTYATGARVNLEADLIARYVARLMATTPNNGRAQGEPG